ncbi:MAG: Hsp20/alpha crystallin family protein [Candidatus Hodarchaeales archaeon]
MNRKRRFFDDFWNFDLDEVFPSFDKEMNELMRSSSEDEENGPISYGYSVRIGPDTNYQPEVRQWGNLNDYRRKRGLPEIEFPFKEIGNFLPETSAENHSNERFVDFIDEGKNLRIIVEVPGFTKEDLSIDVNEEGTEISLNGKAEGKELNHTIQLPSKIEAKSTKSTIKNGVLEITGKKNESSSKVFRVKIK